METNKNRLRIGTAVRVKLDNQYYHGVITRICDNEHYNIKLDNNSNNVEIITEALKSSRGQKIKAIIDVNNFSINNNLY